jgi:SPOR domain
VCVGASGSGRLAYEIDGGGFSGREHIVTMADRYQDRPFSADGFGRGGDQHQRAEADPLAELARLIGQNDPLAASGRGNPPLPPRATPPNQYQPVQEDKPAGGPPPWMRRANPQEIPREAQRETRDFPGIAPEPLGYPSSTHPLQPRFAGQPPALEPDLHHEEPDFARTEEELDPARYDDALYGQVDTGAQDDFHRDHAFPDDPYGYQDDGYEDENEEEEPEPKRRGGLLTVVAVLALAVVGTGAAFAYRTYVGSSRSGEPPIIKADNTPTKVMPAPADSAKVPDRLAMGDGTEKLVPREEAPVDVNSRSIGGGPRVVFPQLNPNGNPPSVSSVSPNAMPPAGASGAPGNGTMANNEPRRIRTLSVRGDQPDAAAAPTPAPPATKPAAGAKAAAHPAPSPANANASANSPLTLAPQSAQDSVPPPADQRARVATNTATQTAPAASAASSGASGGYLVQISSQRSEADAQASFKALQGKFPGVLGSQTPVIKRAELGDKGIYYRAMVGPFGTSDEAAQFCNSLRGAGGQCFVPKN